MKLKKEFLVHHTRGETILVPAGGADFSGVVRGNQTFGAILELLQTDTDLSGIVSGLLERFDAPEAAVEKDAEKALDELRKIGAIDE